MINSRNAVQGSIQLILTALAGTFGFKVIFGAFSTASINFTDKVFRFPYLPLEVTSKDVKRLYGYMWHEMTHAKYTNPKALDVLKPEARRIFGALEDVYSETAHNRHSEYAKSRMEALTEILIEDGQLGSVCENDDPSVVFTNFLLNYGYGYVVRHGASKPLANNDEKIFKAKFGEPLLIKTKALIHSLEHMVDSLEVAALSNHFIDVLQEEKERRDEQQPQENHTQNQSKDNEPAQSPSSGSAPEQSQDGGNKQQSQQSNSQSQKQESTSAGSMQADSGSLKSENEGIIDAIQSLLSDTKMTQGDDKRSNLHIDNLEAKAVTPFKYESPSIPLLDSEGDISSFKVLPSLAFQVKRAFESKNKRRVSKHNVGVRLHKGFPLLMETHNGNIFRRKNESKAMNTHVSIAWDTSGSMNSECRMLISRQAVVSMIDAFEKTRGLTSSVCEFSGRYKSGIRALKSERNRLDQVKGNFLSIAKGGTPTEYGQYWCFEQCVQSTAARNIIIIITDGQPNSRQHISTINRLCQRAGIEVYAIGLKAPGITSLWERSININEISDLPYQIASIVK